MRSVRLGLFLLLSFSACGESKVPVAPGSRLQDSGEDPYQGDASGGTGGGGSGKGGAGGAGGSAGDGSKGDGGIKAAGPQVTIMSPTAAQDPNADQVITDSTVKVVCKVERATESGAAAVDKSAVKISLRDPIDPDKWTDSPVNAAADDTYEANFDLAAYPNGTVHFRCIGKDLAAMANSTVTALDTFLDLGPKIEVVSPNKMIYPLKTPVGIQFKVSRNPVAGNDSEADVDKISLTVAGVDTKFEESTDTPGLYQTSVDFDDRTKFAVPPEAAQLQIIASDKRSDKPGTRTVKVNITIDGQGPTIVVKAPGNGEIVNGTRVLEVEVTDPSGILPASLVATFNTKLFQINTWDVAGNVYKQRFDTRSFGGDPAVAARLTKVTLAITAKDTVGNESTVPHTLKLDNQPPIISLDPPHIRERRDTNGKYCSALFDPVGDYVPNDGESIGGSRTFRVLVEDTTNRPVIAPGDPEPTLYIAGVNSAKVEIFMQSDTSIPLLIDSDGNGLCDEINYDALPMAKRPPKLQLAPVTPTGNAYWPLFDSNAVGNVGCYATTEMPSPVKQPDPPASICPFCDMYRVVPARNSGRPAAVYAIRPTNSNVSQGDCAGDTWELFGLATPGWICMAARAEDTIGNIGVSAPLRLCYGDNENMTPDCSGSPMPDCTELNTTTNKKCKITESYQFSDNDGSWWFP